MENSILTIKEKLKAKYLRVSGLMFLLMTSANAWAITKPQAKTFGYEIYDVAVNQMLNGPLGFVAGLGMVILSAIKFTQNWLLAAAGILGGTAIIKADSITQTMGLIL